MAGGDYGSMSAVVRAALEAGLINPSRYRIYGEILEELQRKTW